MLYDTVIFDLDGTLLDTLPDLHGAVNHALEENGFPERTIDEVRAFVGNGIFNLIKRAVPAGASEEATLSTFESFKAYYKDHANDKTAPYDGIDRLISRLREKGIKLGVVSNKAQFAVSDIMEHYFGGLFDVAFGECEGKPRKPAPDRVFEAMGILGGERALYVGDSEVDVETAKNAGLDAVLVTWGFRSRSELEAAGAKVFAHTSDELYRIIIGE